MTDKTDQPVKQSDDLAPPAAADSHKGNVALGSPNHVNRLDFSILKSNSENREKDNNFEFENC